MTNNGSKKDAMRSVPAIVIDTELANMQYENHADMEQLASPEEDSSPEPKMIHIEGEQEDLSSQKSEEEEEEEESDGDPDNL